LENQYWKETDDKINNKLKKDVSLIYFIFCIYITGRKGKKKIGSYKAKTRK